jgi:hypothetical protein
LKVTEVGTIEDFEDREDLQLVTVDLDVWEIQEHYGNITEIKQFNGFLVKVKDGDYDELYGFKGVPFLWKPLYRLEED